MTGEQIRKQGRPWDFVPMVVLALVAPVLIALVLAMRGSYLVHKIVVDAFGPLVPDSGAGAPAQRIRALGTVLVVAGSRRPSSLPWAAPLGWCSARWPSERSCSS